VFGGPLEEQRVTSTLSMGGEFPLQKVRQAILGLVSTKAPAIESVDALKRRIDDAAEFIDIERLCLSPQCGFASVPARAGRGFPMDLTQRKLARVVEVAEQVWN
jgi:methionine synthase II (cobalamin-independent)